MNSKQVGCPTKIKQDPNDNTSRVCPRCNNAAVINAKSRMWFELFWIPLIPMNSNRIWLCTICHWEVPHKEGYAPAMPGQAWQPPQGVYPQQPPPSHGYGYGAGK